MTKSLLFQSRIQEIENPEMNHKIYGSILRIEQKDDYRYYVVINAQGGCTYEQINKKEFNALKRKFSLK